MHTTARNGTSGARGTGAICLAIGMLLLGAVTTGCENAKQDINDIFHLKMPTPSEAATWMFHRDPEKRRLGITLIANSNFGGEEAYLKVYREAVTDVDPLVRAAAVHALAIHGDGTDAPAAAGLLNDESRLVRWEAAKALQRLHDPEVVPQIIEAMLNDEEADVRMATANALGQYAEPRVLDALMVALDDRSLSVNQNARRALRVLTGEDFSTDRDEWLAWYRSTEDPFAGRKQYLYPVYSREHDWFEKITPFGAGEFEEPGEPREKIDRRVVLTDESDSPETDGDDQPNDESGS